MSFNRRDGRALLMIIFYRVFFFFEFQNLIALCLVFASLTSAHPVPEAESEAKSYYVSCSRKNEYPIFTSFLF
jgi:hypothetical protein